MTLKSHFSKIGWILYKKRKGRGGYFFLDQVGDNRMTGWEGGRHFASRYFCLPEHLPPGFFTSRYVWPPGTFASWNFCLPVLLPPETFASRYFCLPEFLNCRKMASFYAKVPGGKSTGRQKYREAKGLEGKCPREAIVPFFRGGKRPGGKNSSGGKSSGGKRSMAAWNNTKKVITQCQLRFV